MKSKLKVALLTLMVLLISSTFIVSVYAAEENIALNSKVEASGYFAEATSDESPEMAVDGDIETKWCARPAELPEEGDYHWIILDLGAEKTIGKYVLQNASLAEMDLGKTDFNLVEFTLEASSDKEKWTEIDSEDANEEETYEKSFAEPVKARYLRLNCIIPTASGDQTVRLPEIEVYATGAANTDGQKEDPKNEKTEEPTTKPTVAPTAKPTPKPTIKPSPSKAATPANTNPLGQNNLGLYIGIGLVALAVIVIIVLVVRKNKSKKA